MFILDSYHSTGKASYSQGSRSSGQKSNKDLRSQSGSSSWYKKYSNYEGAPSSHAYNGSCRQSQHQGL